MVQFGETTVKPDSAIRQRGTARSAMEKAVVASRHVKSARTDADGAVVRRYSNHPRRQLWRGARAYLREERRDLVQVALIMAAFVAALGYWQRTYLGGLACGVRLAGFVAVVSWTYLTVGDGARYLHGAWAEDWTREELQAAVKRGDAWQVVDNIQLQGGDIDHVLITPRGVLAIETKYYGREGRARYVAEHAGQAKRSARRVAGLLGTVKAHRHPVHAMLVAWGPGARGLTDAPTPNDVVIVSGKTLRSALKRFATGSLAADHAETLGAALTAYRGSLPRR